MIKKSITLFFVLIIITSCSSNGVSLAPTEWTCYDSGLSENICLSFNNGTAYSLNCECSEHISECGKYYYNVKDGILNLSQTNEKVIYLDKHYLILSHNDAVKTYRSTINPPYDDYAEIAHEYINGKNSPYLSILSLENNQITVAPYDYDADTKDRFKDYITKIDVCENISFLSVTVKNDNGKESIECRELAQSEHENIGEFFHTGYIVFDNSGKVSAIIFYGETIIQG